MVGVGFLLVADKQGTWPWRCFSFIPQKYIKRYARSQLWHLREAAWLQFQGRTMHPPLGAPTYTRPSLPYTVWALHTPAPALSYTMWIYTRGSPTSYVYSHMYLKKPSLSSYVYSHMQNIQKPSLTSSSDCVCADGALEPGSSSARSSPSLARELTAPRRAGPLRERLLANPCSTAAPGLRGLVAPDFSMLGSLGTPERPLGFPPVRKPGISSPSYCRAWK